MERIVEDSFGRLEIPPNRKWGPQTQRSLENFSIHIETMPEELIYSYALIKKSAAKTNTELGKLEQDKAKAIMNVCDEIIDGKWPEEFPLSVWQTGSGTQTNMNINEVIAGIINIEKEEEWIHPNDDVNMGQSTNDTFPTAMHLSGVMQIEQKLLPVLEEVEKNLLNLEERYKRTIKLGRTHLQDATPITFGQEVSGWRAMIEQNREMILNSIDPLLKLPLGGTAVGTGLNTHPEFSKKTIEKIAQWTGLPFIENPNKFHGLASKDAIIHVHGVLKTLAANALKIANDIRWLASGPRSGFGEIEIPQNEPGSSIMPGKINPTQAEALSMVCVQVMGNDTTISIAGSQGNFELNVYMPVIIYNFIQSINLLSDSLKSFNEKCLAGIEVNEERMSHFVENSLMLVTALSPHIGYDNATKIAKKAYENNITLKEAAVESDLVTSEEFEKYIDPEKMV
jgi:fumarate hydratase class II